MTPYTLLRSRRKTLAIHITKTAKVEVRAPLKMPKADIERFVNAKQDWIDKHWAVRANCLAQKATFALRYGDCVLMQGRECLILSNSTKKAYFDDGCFYLPPDLSPEAAQQAVIQIYRQTAKTILPAKVANYAMHMNITPRAVKINNAKTRWGSCSSINNLNFSWRLVMADEAAIDYVVVHELAHIFEHNHSNRFWAIVAHMLPDYTVCQLRLKALQRRLDTENW